VSVNPPTAPLLRLDRLTRRLPSGVRLLTVLDQVSLDVFPGEVIAILGPSGSGKSTLLALVAGLDRPTSGEVWLDGQPVHALSEDALALLRRRAVGFVFQSFQLLPHLTALENVLVPLELRAVAQPEARAAALLAEVGLGERTHHYPAQLSGGEQQRVALARAFAGDPPLLLADEPTGNLDSATGVKVLDLLLDLQRRAGSTLVLVTHDPSVAARADRRIYLRDGKIEREEVSDASARKAAATPSAPSATAAAAATTAPTNTAAPSRTPVA
jgi:putative ABC transport system ATP-binding protein